MGMSWNGHRMQISLRMDVRVRVFSTIHSSPFSTSSFSSSFPPPRLCAFVGSCWATVPDRPGGRQPTLSLQRTHPAARRPARTLRTLTSPATPANSGLPAAMNHPDSRPPAPDSGEIGPERRRGSWHRRERADVPACRRCWFAMARLRVPLSLQAPLHLAAVIRATRGLSLGQQKLPVLTGVFRGK